MASMVLSIVSGIKQESIQHHVRRCFVIPRWKMLPDHPINKAALLGIFKQPIRPSVSVVRNSTIGDLSNRYSDADKSPVDKKYSSTERLIGYLIGGYRER
jgi:hypothetical protein